MTAENMARRREYRRNHPHPESQESRKKTTAAPQTPIARTG
jgi:hypothetical protein